MDWMKIAVTLPVLTSVRLDCYKCHGKKSASISNRGKFYRYGCFKCKDDETQPVPKMTPQERRRIAQEAAAFTKSEPRIPTDFTTEIPLSGLLWLSKGGLHIDDIKEYGFGWSEKMHRVIMPVHKDEALVAVQARSVTDIRPKYLGQVWSGRRPVFKSRLRRDGSTSSVLVLTEDILSACRVGKVFDTWALLGTNLHHATIEDIANSDYDRVAVWMDNDEAGISARRKMLKQLTSVGIDAYPAISDKDPKHHTLKEMKDIIDV